MYDFRQKRRSTRAKTRPVLRAKKVVLQPVSHRRPLVKRPTVSRRAHHISHAHRNESFFNRLTKTLTTILIGLLIVAVCAYFFVTKIATFIWPLTSVQTLVLVPEVSEMQPLPWVQILILDPKTQTAQLAQLPGDLSLSAAGDLQVSSLKNELLNRGSSSGIISLKLGRVIDSVVTVPGNQPLKTHGDARHMFQHLMGQELPSITLSQKFRWWLFSMSLSDTEFRAKTITSYSGWESWLMTVAQQESLASCSLALINTTPTSGLSRFISQVMEQSGYQVIRVDSEPKFLEKSQLFISPQRLTCLSAVQRLQDFLPEHIEVVQDLAATQQARADIVWLLGNDVAGQAGQVIR